MNGWLGGLVDGRTDGRMDKHFYFLKCMHLEEIKIKSAFNRHQKSSQIDRDKMVKVKSREKHLNLIYHHSKQPNLKPSESWKSNWPVRTFKGVGGGRGFNSITQRWPVDFNYISQYSCGSILLL